MSDHWLHQNLWEQTSGGIYYNGLISNAKVMLTPDGGVVVKLINKTGVPSVKGEVVNAHSSVAGAVSKMAKVVLHFN